MELIPILSMIILVATIATFILSIGAYILYKVREKSGRVAAPQAPREIEAELVTPQAATATQAEQFAVIQPRLLERPTGAGQQYRRPSYGVQTPPAAPVYAPRYAAAPQPQPVAARRQGGEYIAPQQQQQQERARQGSNKYMTYTAEGYVASKEDKTGGALKWR